MFLSTPYLRRWGLATAAAVLFSPASALPSAPVEIEPAIIPQPRQISVEQRSPGFLLQRGIRADSATSHSELGRAAICALTAAEFSVLPEEMQGELTVELSSLPHPEAYSLEVTPRGISSAPSRAFISTSPRAGHRRIHSTPVSATSTTSTGSMCSISTPRYRGIRS